MTVKNLAAYFNIEDTDTVTVHSRKITLMGTKLAVYDHVHHP
jgi:hypothetical protein